MNLANMAEWISINWRKDTKSKFIYPRNDLVLLLFKPAKTKRSTYFKFDLAMDMLVQIKF